jgi:putative transcriptional regulator
MRLGNRVREQRQQRGLTQEALASSVGITRQSVIAIEKDKFAPSVRLALLIARALGVGVEEIFWLDDNSSE